jgi:hypothetical protein
MNNVGYENASTVGLVEVRAEGLILNKNKVTASPSGKPRLQQRQVEIYEG